MRNIIVIILILFIVSCGKTRIVYKKVTEYRVPNIQCPVPQSPSYENDLEGDSVKEYLDKLIINLDLASKYIHALKESIDCYKRNIELYKENGI